MTETEWLASDDPVAMLDFLRHGAHSHGGPFSGFIAAPGISGRKMRLFACACCRQIWHLLTDVRSRQAVEVAERYADGGSTAGELKRIADNTFTGCCVEYMGRCRRVLEYSGDLGLTPAAQAALLRDVAGNPWRPVMRVGMDWEEFVHHDKHILFYEKWLAWNGGLISSLAQSIYEDRAFDRMPILADALEDAGCDDADVLMHCRGYQRCHNCLVEGEPCAVCFLTPPVGWFPSDADNYKKPHGPHARGCWVLDLMLGKG